MNTKVWVLCPTTGLFLVQGLFLGSPVKFRDSGVAGQVGFQRPQSGKNLCCSLFMQPRRAIIRGQCIPGNQFLSSERV